jgi:hypothetical protein
VISPAMGLWIYHRIVLSRWRALRDAEIALAADAVGQHVAGGETVAA